MLTNLNEIFEYANKHKIAIGAFNIPTLPMIRSVIETAEKNNTPVIIQHTEGHNHFISMEEVAYIGRYYAEKASIPVCLHLDHGSSFAQCTKAIDLGFTSVMIDWSMKSFEENVVETQKVVQYAKPKHVTVEAELGYMLNSEVGKGEGVELSDSEYQYTDPFQAASFVNQTSVDCLAIAVGTVHGLYITEPKLNLEVIEDIATETRVPLVLHGGSGLKDYEYKIAIRNGIRKINYYTYMNKAGGEAVRNIVNETEEYYFFDDQSHKAEEAMKRNIDHFLQILLDERNRYENCDI